MWFYKSYVVFCGQFYFSGPEPVVTQQTCFTSPFLNVRASADHSISSVLSTHRSNIYIDKVKCDHRWPLTWYNSCRHPGNQLPFITLTQVNCCSSTDLNHLTLSLLTTWCAWSSDHSRMSSGMLAFQRLKHAVPWSGGYAFQPSPWTSRLFFNLKRDMTLVLASSIGGRAS